MRTRAVLALAGLALGGAGLWVWSALWTPVPEGLPPHTAAPPEIAAEIKPPVSTRFLPPVVRFEPAPVEVAVDRAGRIWLRGREIRENLLHALRRETLLSTPNGLVAPGVLPLLLIRADAAARWEDVEAVLEAASHPLLDIPIRYLVVRSPSGDVESPIRLRLTPAWSPGRVRRVTKWFRVRVEQGRSGPLVATWGDLDTEKGTVEGIPAIRGLLRFLRHQRDEDGWWSFFRHGRDEDSWWSFDPIVEEIGPGVAVQDAVRFLDVLEPFRRAGRHEFMAFPPEVPLHPVAVGYAGDDGHAVFLLVVAGVAIVLLCLFGGPPTELSLLFALKLPASFFIATGLFAIGRDSVRQWAIPLTGALLLWLFARPRLVRWSAPSLLAFAALLLSLDLGAVLQQGEFVGDPARPAGKFEAPSTREERLWHVASVIGALDAEAPEGPLLESPLARRLDAWDRRFLERAGLVEVKAEPRWHTFLTGIYRVAVADPYLVVWYPGGPAKEAADRLEFRRYAGSTPSRVNTKE